MVTYSILTAIVACFPPDQSTNFAAQRAGIAMIFLTSIFFSLSFGPVSWVLASEVRQDIFGHIPCVLNLAIGVPYEDALHRDKCRDVRQLGFQRPVLTSKSFITIMPNAR